MKEVTTQFNLSLENSPKLVSTTGPLTRQTPESSSTSEVFIVIDSPSPSRIPRFLKLNHLTNRPIHDISGFPGGICAVTRDGELLVCDSVLSEELNESVAFVACSPLELLDVWSVDCGAEHKVLIARQGPKCFVFGMGSNVWGQLGAGKECKYIDKFRRINMPEDPHFVEVKCGSFFTLLLTRTAEVWVFGHNCRGQLGIGNSCECITEPRRCSSLECVSVCGLAAGTMHSLALTITGVVYAAGGNQQGQLGLERKDNHENFTVVSDLADIFIVKIAAYGFSSAAIDEFGSVYVWGERFGNHPHAWSVDLREGKFVDVALGSDGRVVALTDMHKIFICSSDSAAAIVSPSLPFCSVHTGGDFCVVLANRNGELPLARMECELGKCLLPPKPVQKEILKDRLRPPLRIVALSSFHFPQLALMPSAQQILKSVFSSSACLNASFLIDNFNELLLDMSSGIDIDGLIQAYQVLCTDTILMLTVTSTFNRLLLKIHEHPPVIRRPSVMRFLAIGLFHPSCLKMREGYDYWRNLVNVIHKLNAYSILSQWISVMNADHIRCILGGLKDLVSFQAIETKQLYLPSMIKSVRAIEMVWSAATRSKKLEFKEFYHDTLNQVIDIRVDYQIWESSESNWCYSRCAPWLLNADTKTRFLHVSSRVMMNRRQISAMERATHFWGEQPVVTPMDLFLIFDVSRDNLVSDTFRAIAELKDPDLDLKKPLKVHFRNEPAVDEGGVQREFFELIVQQLFDPERNLFQIRGDVYWLSPEATDPASLQAYYLTGCIFGLAIYNGNLLSVRFPLVLYKKLRGLTVSFHDLKEIDPQLMESLENVLKYPNDVENDLCLSFEYCGVPLCPDGENRMVTNGNREEYAELLTKHILNGSIQRQFEQFKFGFLQSAGNVLLDLFRPEEIALMIGGTEELDFHALEKVTRYEGFEKDSPTVQTFWRIVHHRLTDEEKRKLLYFVTASPRAPINGLGSVPFVIARDGEMNHIPTSHTCFCMLVLPDDPLEESLYRKLKIAIDNSEGFAFK